MVKSFMMNPRLVRMMTTVCFLTVKGTSFAFAFVYCIGQVKRGWVTPCSGLQLGR